MRILIIHTAFIGDIVLSTPLVRKIKESYPDSYLAYVTTPAGAQILKNNPNIDEIIEYDKRGRHKGIRGIYDLGKRLRYENFNMVITPHRYMRSSFLSWISGASVRKGYDSAAGSFFFTEKIHYDKTKHEVEKLLSFVDCEEANNKRYEIELFPSKEAEEKAANIWKANDLENKKTVILAPGSKWFTKQWPVEYFNEVIDKLSKDKNIGIAAVGGKEEVSIPLHTENIIDLRGKTTLEELGAVLKRGDIVITNDSSPIHIASAFEKPRIIALFGPTIKEFGFFPWSRNSEVLETENLSCRPCGIHGGNSCPQKHFKCMRDIVPEKVVDAVYKYLRGQEHNE